MGSVRRTPYGTWQARWRPPGSTRVKGKTFRRKRDAEAFLARVESRKLEGTYRDPNTGRVPLRPYLEDYLAGFANDGTQRTYRSVAKNHILPALGEQLIATVSPADVRGMLAAIGRTGAGAQTQQTALKVLSGALKRAVGDGLIPSNPCSLVSGPRVRQRQLTIPDPEEVALLAQSIDPRYRGAVLAGAYAGLRVGEALALRKPRLLERRLEIVEAYADDGRLGPPKGGRTRTIPIPLFLVEELSRHAGGELLFPREDGRPTLPGYFRQGPWSRVRRELGLGLRFHDLRHFFAAVAIAQGAHPKAIQELMGHSSIRVTMDIYGHLFPSLGEDIAAKLEEIGRGSLVADSWPQEGARVVQHPAARR